MRLPEYGLPLIFVFEHTYARPLYTPVAPSGAQNEPGRRLATTGDPPGAKVVEAPIDATVVTVVAVMVMDVMFSVLVVVVVVVVVVIVNLWW